MEVDFQGGDNTTFEDLKNLIKKQEKEITSLNNRIVELLTYSKGTSSTNLNGKHIEAANFESIIIKQEKEIIFLKAEVDKLTCTLKEKDTNLVNVAGKEKSYKLIEHLEVTTKDLQYENKCLRACLLPISPHADNAALLELEVKNNEKLRIEVEELKKKLEDQNFWNIESSDVYIELRRQYNVLEAKNDDQQYMIKSLLETEKKFKQVEYEMTTLHNKYQNTLHRNNLLQTEMENQIKQYKDIAKEAENDNFLLKEQLRELKCMHNANAADKILLLEEKIKQLYQEKQDLEKKLATDREKLANILERLEKVIRYHKKQKVDLLSEIDQLNIKICELQGMNASLEIKLGDNNQIMDGVVNNKILHLQAELDISNTDKLLLKERLLAFSKQHDDIIVQIKESVMKQVENESEILQLQAKLNKELHINNKLEYQLNEANEYLTELKDEVKKRNAEFDKEENQFKAKSIVLQKERDLVICENNELTLRMADIQKNATKLLTTSSKLEAKINENTALKSELEMTKKRFQGKITNAKIIILQLKSDNTSLKTQVTDLIKTMKVEDNIDLLVQDRFLEKKSLHEKIQQLEANLQEIEIKYKKCLEDLEKQSKYYKGQLDELLIDKNTQIQNLKDEYNKNLSLAKLQYDKDTQFIHGRHNEAIMKLQGMHEDGIKEKVKEHEVEIEDLKAQKQAYREALRKKRREVEDLRDEMTTLQKEHNKKIEEMKKMFEADRKRSTENISKLAQKCWIELGKIQVIDKENQYIKERAEQEILLAKKRSEFGEIEKKLKNIQIVETVKNNESIENNQTKDWNKNIKSNDSIEKESSEFEEIEKKLKNLQITVKNNESIESNQTKDGNKNIKNNNSTEKDSSDTSSSWINLSPDYITESDS